MLVKDNRAFAYNGNSDNMQFCFTGSQYFYAIISSTCPKYVLHILHGHTSGIHLLILNLKALTDSDFFISLNTKSHIFGPR